MPKGTRRCKVRAMTIRDLDRTTDRRAVEAIDTTFETSTVFDVVTSERSLLLALRGALPGARLYLTDGAGRPRWVESGWRIPRGSADVARAARLVARDPAWVYPAALALLGGAEAPTAAAAEAWRRRDGG